MFPNLDLNIRGMIRYFAILTQYASDVALVLLQKGAYRRFSTSDEALYIV
jgi:hypothetical protein